MFCVLILSLLSLMFSGRRRYVAGITLYDSDTVGAVLMNSTGKYLYRQIILSMSRRKERAHERDWRLLTAKSVLSATPNVYGG